MKRTKKAAQAAANEWKSRGFKSSKPESEEKTPIARQRVAKPEGETIKKTWTKPANSFKVKDDSPQSPDKQRKVSGTPKKESGAEGGEASTPQKKRKVPKAVKKESGTGGGEVTPSDGAGGEAPEKPKVEGKRKKQKFKAGSYNLFIGNLSYETTREDILNHFSKAGPIKDVRIPLTKETNEPRGFAYMEVEDHVTYEKVLSLHHTFLKKRRINVECTFGGSKDSQKRKALIKKKTLKLRFLSREGKISSANQKKWGKFKQVPNGEFN